MFLCHYGIINIPKGHFFRRILCGQKSKFLFFYEYYSVDDGEIDCFLSYSFHTAEDNVPYGL